MNFQTFQDKFVEWIISDVEAKKIDGFPVCPFARKARLTNKIQFLDCRDNLKSDYQAFDKSVYEIAIAWVGDQDIDDVQIILDDLSKENPDLLYFTSTPESGHFVQNFTNCVFIQLKSDIVNKRSFLHTTSYYDSWPKDYYESITKL